MTAEFIEKQKKALVSEKKRLLEKIAKYKKYPDYGFDQEDNVGEMTDFETNISVENQLELLLKKVNYALSAIEKGSYGQCFGCKKAIEEGRLSVMPYANLCVSCNQKQKK